MIEVNSSLLIYSQHAPPVMFETFLAFYICGAVLWRINQ